MSSSKIIKSQDFAEAGFSEFAYQPIDFGFSLEQTSPEEEGSGFLPMITNGDSGISYGVPQEPVEEELLDEEPAEPAGIFIAEEELEEKLRESFQSGLAEGKKLTERGLLNVFNSLRTATEGLHALRERVLRESEDELLKLTMLIAHKVILQEVRQDEGILLNVVRSAIGRISETDDITIYLNPEDLSLLTSSRGDSFRTEFVTDGMKLKPDPGLLQGSCRIDTEMGTIDASFDAQLEEIYRHMLEERIVSTGAGA